MDELLKKSALDLLEKFGKGEHTPGSGSAAAFQGMLSAQLIKTVISITNEEKYRRYYKKSLEELNRISSEISERIYPKLVELFAADSQQFDRAINYRRLRDAETDPFQKSKYRQQALDALMPATETPIEIAALCIELAELGLYVFENGFQGARGDSAVAFRGSIAALAGCISIIHLNLLSFGSNTWVTEIQERTQSLRLKYSELLKRADTCSELLMTATIRNQSLHAELDSIVSDLPPSSKLTNAQIEHVAKRLQNVMWEYRDVIWRAGREKHQEILDPMKALTHLGYQVESINEAPTFEHDGKVLAVAGIIDKHNRTVVVSKNFGREVEKFTAAHELGHALFHKQEVLHRDRALDGSGFQGERSIEERQADKFASYFLMPERPVRAEFRKLFGNEKFVLDANAIFTLSVGRNIREKDLKEQLKEDPFVIAKLVADLKLSAEDGSRISIAEIFGVSVEAMAIRLKELKIVDI